MIQVIRDALRLDFAGAVAGLRGLLTSEPDAAIAVVDELKVALPWEDYGDGSGVEPPGCYRVDLHRRTEIAEVGKLETGLYGWALGEANIRPHGEATSLRLAKMAAEAALASEGWSIAGRTS